jgi:hypothetical protein
VKLCLGSLIIQPALGAAGAGCLSSILSILRKLVFKVLLGTNPSDKRVYAIKYFRRASLSGNRI